MDKTCKSNGTESVAIRRQFSGERVRNTWEICLGMGNKHSKGCLIPHNATTPPGDVVKVVIRFEMIPRLISLLAG